MMNHLITVKHTGNFSYYRIVGIVFLLSVLLGSCIHGLPTETWKRHYSHLQHPLPNKDSIIETDYYIVFLVAAFHLDYWDNKELLSTLIQYSRRKENIGHSWIYLKGIKDGRPYILEGGHTGQSGETQPRFFEGVINYITYGYANPTDSQKSDPRYEPNPIKYLWDELDDGFFQKGNGDYKPTFAAKVNLTKKQFEEILDFIDPKKYPYGSFSLVGNQCSSFVASLATMVGLPIEHKVTVKLDPFIVFRKKEYRLWTDPKYSEITFSSPDMIERSLMEIVSDGRAEYALGWYLKK